jgi:hypothetical protein
MEAVYSPELWHHGAKTQNNIIIETDLSKKPRSELSAKFRHKIIYKYAENDFSW